MRRAPFVWAAFLFVGATAARESFAPPRTAVVDAAVVFDGYEKSRKIRAEMLKERETLDSTYRDLKRRRDELQRELPNVREDKTEDRLVEIYRLELKMKWIQERSVPALLERRLEEIESIRREIETAVDRYAESADLDLVIEKAFVLEARGAEPLRWPIVHFAKPEIDITSEITLRLNDLYRSR